MIPACLVLETQLLEHATEARRAPLDDLRVDAKTVLPEGVHVAVWNRRSLNPREAVELLAEFEKAGLDRERLIIDPLVVPIIWQDGHLQAGQVLRTIKDLPDVLGFEVKTAVGLSNLTAGAKGHPKRLLLEPVYLSMLAAAGLDMVLLDIFHAETVAAAKAADALIGEKPFAWEEL